MIIVKTLERLLMEARFARLLLIALYGEYVLSLGNLFFVPKCGATNVQKAKYLLMTGKGNK